MACKGGSETGRPQCTLSAEKRGGTCDVRDDLVKVWGVPGDSGSGTAMTAEVVSDVMSRGGDSELETTPDQITGAILQGRR